MAGVVRSLHGCRINAAMRGRWRHSAWLLVLSACAAESPNDLCSATACTDAGATTDRPADARADVARDAVATDARSADATTADAGTPLDVPRSDDATAPADVPLVTDIGAPLDVPTVVDVPAVVDVPRPVDVPVVVDVPVRDVPVTGGCVSGATGTYVARCRWTGSSPGGRASVVYEANTLPDHTRWMVSANSRSIGYTPVWDDPFLGVGGLDLEGTAFIDVSLSTAGLGAIRGVSIAIFGRSFNTTASGSFAWQTFSGTGASPSGLVANSAPYEWYVADASASFVPGDSGVLLRITPGPPSSALIVNRVEICFDAL